MAESKIVTATHNHQQHQDSDTTTLFNDGNGSNIVSSILRNLDLKIKQIPNFFNNLGQVKKEESNSTVVVVKEEMKDIAKKPLDVVRFSDTRPNIPPLEFEAEEPAGRTSNPVVLWQVYAITGFMVLRWVVARWNERKERKAKEDLAEDDDQTQTQTQTDDDDQTLTQTNDGNAQ
jgi:hypothetical protein